MSDSKSLRKSGVRLLVSMSFFFIFFIGELVLFVSLMFQGAIEELKILTKTNGYLDQCPEEIRSKYLFVFPPTLYVSFQII